MEDVEEAIVSSDGSVKIRYYFGKMVLIPTEIMEKYGITVIDKPQNMLGYRAKLKKERRKAGEQDGRV